MLIDVLIVLVIEWYFCFVIVYIVFNWIYLRLLLADGNVIFEWDNQGSLVSLPDNKRGYTDSRASHVGFCPQESVLWYGGAFV